MRKARKYFNIELTTNNNYENYRVTITISGKIYSKSFSITKYGKKGALNKAITYRDNVFKRNNLPLPRKYISKNARPYISVYEPKSNIGITGVTYYEGVSNSNKIYCCYAASWSDIWINGTKRQPKSRVRSFYVGLKDKVTGDNLFHALRTAIQFRKEYERAVLNDAPFDYSRFYSWKGKRLYRKNAYIKFEVSNVG